MKGKILIFTLFIGLFFTTSCEDFLSILPEQSLLTKDVIKTSDDLQRLLNASYDQMRNGGYLGGNMWVAGDMIADNTVKDFSDFGWDQISIRSMNLFNIQGRSMWTEGFRSVDRANFIMENISKVASIPADSANRIKGEALFIRGVGLFELVRMYGLPWDALPNNTQPGVPIRLVSSSTIALASQPIPRSSVADVYAQAIRDLREAESLLTPTNNGYATSWAAKGYLAKVYFQRMQYDSAFFYANDIIENGPFILETELKDRFVAGTTEAIFELISTGAGNNSASSLIGAYRQDGAGNPGFYPNPSFLIQAIKPGDKRSEEYFFKRPIGDESGPQRTYCSKYDFVYMNVPLVHLTEILLIRAEAAVLKSGPNFSIAIADLNQLRDRAYGVGVNPMPDSPTADELLEICRLERRVELAFEGNRLHDLKRIKSTDIRGIAWDDKRLIFQIPDVEQAGNPNIELN